MTTAPPRRRAGRPTGASAEKTRERILDASLKLFSSWGYDATRIKDVALRAEVDAALVHRYFGDKDDLYQEVLQDALRPINVLGKKLLVRGLPTDLLLGAWVEIVSTYFERHPEVLMLVMRESLGTGVKRLRTVMLAALGPVFDATVEALESGLTRQKSRLDAAHLVVNVMGMVAIWQTHTALLEGVLGEPISNDKARLRQRDQIMHLVLHGVLGRP